MPELRQIYRIKITLGKSGIYETLWGLVYAVQTITLSISIFASFQEFHLDITSQLNK